MENNRQQKINRLIQKELSEIFLAETRKMRGVLISVTHVRVTPDMSIARAHLSVFPSDKGEEIIQNANNNTKTIRYELGKRAGKQLRIIPELYFHLDDSLDYIENIDNLLNK